MVAEIVVGNQQLREGEVNTSEGSLFSQMLKVNWVFYRNLKHIKAAKDRCVKRYWIN